MHPSVPLAHVQVRWTGETGVGRTGGQGARVHEPAVHEKAGLGAAKRYGHGVPMVVGQRVREHLGVNAVTALGNVV